MKNNKFNLAGISQLSTIEMKQYHGGFAGGVFLIAILTTFLGGTLYEVISKTPQ